MSKRLDAIKARLDNQQLITLQEVQALLAVAKAARELINVVRRSRTTTDTLIPMNELAFALEALDQEVEHEL